MNWENAKWYWKKVALLLVLCLLLTGCNLSTIMQSQKEVNSNVTDEHTVLLGGMPIGLYLESDGVMILGTDKVENNEGKLCCPAAHLLKAGDYIFAINDKQVQNKKQFIELLHENKKDTIILTVRRNGTTLSIEVDPVESRDGAKLGIWVRDNCQGLGTITYLDNQSEFASLGHGIHDLDTGKLLEINEGAVYKATIRDVQKGIAGIPGSMEGIIVYNHYYKLGTISSNLETGVYGHLDKIDEVFEEQIAIPLARKEEISEGPAYVRCYADGKVQNFTVNISNIDHENHEINKNFEIEICDKKLLDLTGGIIQGMSGSPIVQNGKLIGAVTHVFVNDATKGYGIFIENMSNKAD